MEENHDLPCSQSELELLEEPREYFPFIGFRNMGNTCYLNSVLQILIYCPGFIPKLSATIKQLKDKLENNGNPDDNGFIEDKNKECSDNFKVLKELKKLFLMMNENRSIFLCNKNSLNVDEKNQVCAIRPQTFVQAVRQIYPSFEPFTQQDAQEFLHCVLNCFDSTISLANNQIENLNQKNKTCTDTYKMIGGHKPASTLVLRPSQNKEKLLSTNNKDKNASLLSQQGCFEKIKRKRIKKIDDNKNSDSSDKENSKVNPSDLETPPTPPSKRPRLVSVEVKSNKPSILKTFMEIKNKMTKKKYSIATLKNNVTKFTNHVVPTKFQFIEDKSTKFCPPVVNIVGEMFRGELLSTTKCMECEDKVEKRENFQDISLPVKEEKEQKTSSNIDENLLNHDTKNIEVKPLSCSLSWALTTFMKPQILDGDNKYYCNTCKRLSEGEQKIQFSLLPPVLTFHLKRFSATTSTVDGICSAIVKKILTKMKIPTSIKFSQWCNKLCEDKNIEYKLFGVVVHSGNSIGAGHYLSYVKYQHREEDGIEMSEYNGRWLEMDDERVSVVCDVTMNEILQGQVEGTRRSPYLLFYHKIEN